MYLIKIFAKKKSPFIIVDFQTQFLDNKRKLSRENQWKSIILEKVIPFTKNYSFQWKLFRLVEVIFLIEAIFLIGKFFFSGSNYFIGKLLL